MDEGLVENSENKKRFLDSTHLTRNTKKLVAPFLEILLQHNTSSKVQSPHLSAEKSVKKPLAPMSGAVGRVIEQLESRLDVSAIFCPSSPLAFHLWFQKKVKIWKKNATNCHVTILPLQIRHSAGFMGSYPLLQASHEAPQVLLRQWSTLLVSHLRRSWLTGRDFGG